MKRNGLIVLCVLSLTLNWICPDAKADEKRQLKKIGENVWAYTDASSMTPANSYGANVGVIVGEKGVMVIDTLISAKEAKKLLADIRKVTKLPIRWVVNTHYHLDHALGNCVFVDKGATVIGASPAAKLLPERLGKNLELQKKNPATKEALEGTVIAPATITFTGTMEIDLGNVTVELRSLPHGHAPDNLAVWIPKERILFAGDLLFIGCHPFIGESNIPNWLADLDTLAAFNAEKVVPGHGPLATPKDMEEMKIYLKAFDTNAKELAKGKTQADVVELAKKLEKRLPNQGRDKLEGMIQHNLSMKYLLVPAF